MLCDPAKQLPRGFHIEDDFRPGITLQDIRRKQHELPVGENDAAIFGYYPQTISVAIEGQTQFAVIAGKSIDQVMQVFRLRGIGMMVGEIAIHFTKHFGNGTAQLAIQGSGKIPGHAIATIHGDIHGPRQFNIGSDACNVHGADIVLRIGTCTLAEIVLLNAGAQRLYGVPGKGLAPQYHFQSVVIRGVMAAGNHDGRMRVQMVRSKVHHRRGHSPNVNDVDPALLNAACQCGDKFHAGKPPVAAYDYAVLAACRGFRADGMTNDFNQLRGKRFTHDTANIVSLENFLGQVLHGIPP